MPKLPVISGDRCISALERVGYQVAHIKGSHVRMQLANRNPVTVPRQMNLTEVLYAQFFVLQK
jgi:predicted RNA binding protein YcfA (HicA-like mRNA interferase family)